MRIFHLVAPAPFGGLERVVQSLSIGQKRRGSDVRVVTLLTEGAAEPSITAELLDAGIPVLPVVRPPRSYPAQRRAVLELCQRLLPDVLHSHGYHPDVIAASLPADSAVARVSTLHGFTGGGKRNRFYEWIQRKSLSRLDGVVAVSRTLAETIPHSSGLRIHAVPNAWAPTAPLLSRESAREALGLSADRFHVCWMGRMSHEKGADVLVEALPSLADLPIQVTFIGEGSTRAGLELRCRELGLGRRVQWKGEVRQASRLLSGFDVLVMSSRTEGTPMTLFEAIHAGIPVVATRVGGIPDVVSSREALLVPPEDPAALAAAIRIMYERRAEAMARAERAQQHLAKSFDFESWIDAYDRIYGEAINARRAGD